MCVCVCVCLLESKPENDRSIALSRSTVQSSVHLQRRLIVIAMHIALVLLAGRWSRARARFVCVFLSFVSIIHPLEPGK